MDSGCGARAENIKHPDEPAGLLLDSLMDIGLTAGDIDTVIITHSHWDHFGGLVAEGKPVFLNADVIMSRKEEQYIKDTSMGWALEYLSILEDQISYVDGLTFLDDGITLRPAPGHAPGMIYVEVASNGESLVYVSDIIIHQAHIEHVDWIPSFETDPQASVTSRMKLIEEAYLGEKLLFVPHIPEVIGGIEKFNSGYRWINHISPRHNFI